MSTDTNSDGPEIYDGAALDLDSAAPSRPAESVINERDAAVVRGQAIALAHSLKNGTEPPDITDEQALALNSLSSAPGEKLSSQRHLGTDRYRTGSFGSSHQGDRDYHKNFGYPEFSEVSAADYREYARGQGVAHTLTYRPVASTWRHQPRIHDNGGSADRPPTPFEEDVQSLFDTLAAGKGLTDYFEWVDRKQRPAQYGLLFLGLDDGREMHRPVDRTQLNDTTDLQYCNTFSQADVASWKQAYEFDPDDRNEDGDLIRGEERTEDGTVVSQGVVRPDQPVLYEIEFDYPGSDGEMATVTREVHWTRIIHVAENPTESEWIGDSCLKKHLHRLIDFEKVMGATAEAFYSNVDRKYVGKGDSNGGSLDDDQIELFDEQMRELVDDMRTTVYTEDMDLEVISGDTVNPSGPIDALYQSFAGTSGIPKRILTGSERGELASSQDRANYFDGINERQEQFDEPDIVRATLDRLLWFGVITPPADADNEYTVTWPTLFDLTDLEDAELQNQRAAAIKAAEDAVAMGAPREAVYSFIGIPIDDETPGTLGSGEGAAGGAGAGVGGVQSNDAAGDLDAEAAHLVREAVAMDGGTDVTAGLGTESESATDGAGHE